MQLIIFIYRKTCIAMCLWQRSTNIPWRRAGTPDTTWKNADVYEAARDSLSGHFFEEGVCCGFSVIPPNSCCSSPAPGSTCSRWRCVSGAHRGKVRRTGEDKTDRVSECSNLLLIIPNLYFDCVREMLHVISSEYFTQSVLHFGTACLLGCHHLQP